jgi:hypothetical protein
MVALFTAVGFGQWFRYVTGILELTGAVLIMVPKTRRIGSALLATTMLGALTAHLFILHVPPTTPGVLFLMSGFVVWGLRQYGDCIVGLAVTPLYPTSLPDEGRYAALVGDRAGAIRAYRHYLT